MDQNALFSGKAISEVEHVGKQTRSEMVTVVLRQEDFRRLKEIGGPRSDQIHMALNHYLETIKQTGWSPIPNSQLRFYENVTTFKCTLMKSVCEQIRSLKGRFDHHTIEAVRLFLKQ